MLKGIFFHSQILLAGICAYSALYHFFVVADRAQRRVNQLFAVVSLLMALYTFSNVQCFEQTTLNDFIPNLRLTFVFYILFVGLFPWFITRYSEVRPMLMLVAISAIVTVMFVVNLIEPFTILYSNINEYKHVILSNGEDFYSPRGTAGSWFYLWVATVLFVYLFGICTLIGYYRRNRRSSILVMIFAVGMLLAFSVAGTLFRMGIIHIPPLVPFGFLGIVIMMSLTLNYERQQDRKRANERLSESEFFFRESQRAASIGSYKTDFIAGYWESSNVLDDIFGIDRNYNRNIQGWLEIIYPDDRQMMDQYLREDVISKGNNFSKEYRIVRKSDGETRWVYGLGKVSFDDKNNMQTMIGTIQDITERKLTEVILRESEYELEEAQLLAGTGSWTYDPVIQKSTWSKGMFHIWGRDPALGLFPVEDYQKFIHPDDYQQFEVVLKEAVDHGVPYTMELRINRPDGEQITIITICEPICDEKGNVVKLRGTNQDITERKKAEELLHITRFSIDHSSDGLFWITSDSRIVDVNEAAYRSLGYSREELLKLSLPDVDPLYNSDVWQQFYKELQQKGTRTFETEHLTKDGKRFPVEIVANLIQIDSKELICGFVRNITDRKRAEEVETRLKLRQRAILDNLPMMAWLKDTEGRLEMVNELFASSSGLTIEQCIGKTDLEIWPDKAMAKRYMDDDHEVCVAGRKKMVEESIVTPDGTKWHLTYKTPLFDENGQVIGTAGIAQDITERKHSEEEKLAFEQQLQHTQKLESLGVLSGGIAHDFNNILAIIMGYCTLTKMDYETAEVNIQEIEKAAERAAGLCRQMLAYAGKAQLSMTQVNMWMLVEEMVNMLKATLPQSAVIKPELLTNIPFISADASQLRQIVMNLIINASEAIGKEQGEIRVSLTESTVLAGQSEQDYHGKEIPPGSYVCLEVTDTGCGMDEETKWRIFEPFYTTKFTGRGLGMSAVLGIINSHNGALQLISQLGKGTTFKVYLPVKAIGNTGNEDKIHALSVPWQGSGTILLVEDEDPIRKIAKILLQKFGFTVLEASNGKEALELYQKNAADITLVLTDMGMPVMDGYALFPALKQLNHKLPIIISSGFGDADVTSRIGRDNIAGIISKPYNPNQLREVLKSALEGSLPAHV